MNTAKKWMVTLSEENYNWIKGLVNDTGVGGSDIIGELILRVKRDRNGDFKQSLINAQTRLKLESLEEKREALDAEIQGLKGKVVRSGDRVTA